VCMYVHRSKRERCSDGSGWCPTEVEGYVSVGKKNPVLWGMRGC
jgi:hypothetical protein